MITGIPDKATVDYALVIAELAVLKRDIKERKVRPFVSETVAFDTYGELNVKNWVKWGVIPAPEKDGSARNCKKRYSVEALEAAWKLSHRGL